MSKIIESASSGNIVSRRLLRFVRLNSESEANISKVDALDSGPWFWIDLNYLSIINQIY